MQSQIQTRAFLAWTRMLNAALMSSEVWSGWHTTNRMTYLFSPFLKRLQSQREKRRFSLFLQFKLSVCHKGFTWTIDPLECYEGRWGLTSKTNEEDTPIASKQTQPSDVGRSSLVLVGEQVQLAHLNSVELKTSSENSEANLECWRKVRKPLGKYELYLFDHVLDSSYSITSENEPLYLIRYELWTKNHEPLPISSFSLIVREESASF